MIGIAFGLLGILYREITISTIDVLEYRLLTLRFRARLSVRMATRWQRVARKIRRIIPRFFLLVPIGAWLVFIWNLGTVISTCSFFSLLSS